jgi:hypothetical protein
MKSQTTTLLNVFAGLLLGFFIVGLFAFKNRGLKDNEPQLKYYAPPLPNQISFAEEKVPLERWDVKERFDRELLFNYYNKANVLYLLKLANRYFPIISEQLKVNGVPDDFKYLCVAESNLLSGARSSVGATGFWQFMSGTAPAYGIEVNNQVDFRHDVEKSTDAACKYLKQAHQKFGTWTGAAASYNCGQGGYASQVTYQGTTHYYDLLLPEETNRYIFRILTFKHLMENAEELGFQLKPGDKYEEIPYKTITISSSITNLAEFAKENGTTYKMLRLHNPWLRGKSLTVSGGRTYQIKLPS